MAFSRQSDRRLRYDTAGLKEAKALLEDLK